LRCLRSLISFLTIIPTGSYDIEEAAKCFPLVPFVGLIVSSIASVPLFLSQKPPFVLLTFLLLYILTGLNHLDGFADFVDTLASGKKGEEALRVLKEPWRGAFSQAALSLVIMSTFISVYYLKKDVLSIIIAHILSYESMYLVANMAPPPPYRGLGRIFIEKSSSSRAKVSNALSLIASLLLLYIVLYIVNMSVYKVISETLVVVFISVLVSYISSKQAKGTLGFVNGDVMGYTLELSRTLNLLGIALLKAIVPSY
jgi:adenosylcobinamide-GDP ribazoletransferase